MDGQDLGGTVPSPPRERRSTSTARASDFFISILFTVLSTAAPFLGHVLVTASVVGLRSGEYREDASLYMDGQGLGLLLPPGPTPGANPPVPDPAKMRTLTARASDSFFIILFTVLPTAAPFLGHLLVTASVGAYGQGSIERRPRQPSVQGGPGPFGEDLGLR